MLKKFCWRRCLLLLLMCTLSLGLYAQSQTIKGTVKDQTGEPIAGATILEVGTSNGTTTDIDGNFTFKATSGANLLVSYVGFESQQLKASQNMTITMSENTELMDEVVVVGYGVQKKKLLTGSTINISGDEIAKQNTNNAMGALYSSVPGVNIVAGNGQPWSDFTITVRGLNTTGSSGPLYVIDGIAGGSISSLNPADIESIDILKDAASAAIYGARASGGVILVTTKQGQAGKVRISYDGYVAWQKPNFNDVSTVSAQKYIELVDEAFRSNNAAFSTPEHYFDYNALMPVQYKQIQNGTFTGTNWLEESVNDNSMAYNHAVNITGGNAGGHYAIGFSHSKTDGTLGSPQKTFYKRTTVRLNSDYVLLNRKGLDMIKIGENATLSIYDNNSVSQGDIYGNMIHTMLTYTSLLPAYNADGSYYNWDNQKADGWQAVDGAYNLLEMASQEQTERIRYRIQSNAWIEIVPHKDWKFRSVYGWQHYQNNTRTYVPAYQLSGTKQNEHDDIRQEMGVSNNWSWENTLSWKHKFGNHNVDALVGTSMEATDWGMSVGGTRQQSRFGTWNSANLSSSDSDIDAQMVGIWGGNTVPYKNIISFFGRANYNYKETYLMTLILRQDGSSNFASGRRWGTFPSVSAGWVATNEKFMESTKNWLDFLKLRASWGQNGNCSIANFQYAATVSLDAPYDFTKDGSSTSTGAFPDIIPNPDLTWETTEQTDLGFDARFFNSRLGVAFDWYNKETKDWLVSAPSLDSYGTGSPVINGGAVRNRGIELALNWNDKVGDFRYGVSVNMSHNKNKVLYIDNADGILHGGFNVIAQNINTYNTFEARPGKPIGYFTGIASDGIFQNQAEIDAWNAAGKAFMDGYEAAKPGDVKWIDQNADGTFNDDDVVEIGNPHPDVNLGFNINMSWKGIDLSINGSGAFGHQILQSYRSFANGDLENFTTNFVDRLWTGEGSSNHFPRFTYGKHNNFYCKGYVGDVWIQDADYLKIRNITIGYDFKQAFKKLPLEQCRIYFTGQNLLTFTGYDGMDPEVGYGYGYAWASGIDIGSYPSARSYMIGLNLKF